MKTAETGEFDALVGQELPFYGVDGHCFKIGDTVWHAAEDESDGYRSYLGCIEVVPLNNLIFFPLPLATVRVESFDELPEGACDRDEGFRLVDSDGHIWLRVGTNDYDDYYPYFVFEYTPKQPHS